MLGVDLPVTLNAGEAHDQSVQGSVLRQMNQAASLPGSGTHPEQDGSGQTQAMSDYLSISAHKLAKIEELIKNCESPVMTTEESKNSDAPAPLADTGTIVRDALVLQGKLIIDGLRDAMLIPISLIAAVIGLMQRGDERGKFFYEVVAMGRRSERWINLFGAADRIARRDEAVDDIAGLDTYLVQVEERLTRDYQKGEMSRAGREVLAKLKDGVEIARQRFLDANDDTSNKDI